MTASLFILCLSAFAIIAAAISLLCLAALPWLDRLALGIIPRYRARLWLGLLAAPATLGLLAVVASFLPALGIGHDHCLSHAPHHPHLCPHHLGDMPGVVLVVLAAVVVLRVGNALTGLVRGLLLCRATAADLALASERYADVVVLPSEKVQAFVLGALRPRVHISRGVLAFDSDIVAAVLAHERAHADHRDLLWRALSPLFAVGHLPGVTDLLVGRLVMAQELAADAEAAASLHGGRLGLAEALVFMARRAECPALGLSFTHGDLKARVRALLEESPVSSPWMPRLLLMGALFVPLLFGVAHEPVHHALETLLGVLS